MRSPTEEVQELDSGLGSSKTCNLCVSAGDNTYSDADNYSQLAVPSIQKQSREKWIQVMQGTVVLNHSTASDCAGI